MQVQTVSISSYDYPTEWQKAAKAIRAKARRSKKTRARARKAGKKDRPERLAIAVSLPDELRTEILAEAEATGLSMSGCVAKRLMEHLLYEETYGPILGHTRPDGG